LKTPANPLVPLPQGHGGQRDERFHLIPPPPPLLDPLMGPRSNRILQPPGESISGEGGLSQGVGCPPAGKKNGVTVRVRVRWGRLGPQGLKVGCGLAPAHCARDPHPLGEPGVDGNARPEQPPPPTALQTEGGFGPRKRPGRAPSAIRRAPAVVVTNSPSSSWMTDTF